MELEKIRPLPKIRNILINLTNEFSFLFAICQNYGKDFNFFETLFYMKKRCKELDLLLTLPSSIQNNTRKGEEFGILNSILSHYHAPYSQENELKALRNARINDENAYFRFLKISKFKLRIRSLLFSDWKYRKINNSIFFIPPREEINQLLECRHRFIQLLHDIDKYCETDIVNKNLSKEQISKVREILKSLDDSLFIFMNFCIDHLRSKKYNNSFEFKL